MTVLLDTNIILDALLERQPFDVAAKEVLRKGRDGKVTVCFTANAATDIFYLYAKTRDVTSARSAMDYLLDKYTVVAVTHEDCKNAMSITAITDFEDALVVACAKKAKVDYIVSRDEKFTRVSSEVKVIQSHELLAMVQ